MAARFVFAGYDAAGSQGLQRAAVEIHGGRAAGVVRGLRAHDRTGGKGAAAGRFGSADQGTTAIVGVGERQRTADGDVAARLLGRGEQGAAVADRISDGHALRSQGRAAGNNQAVVVGRARYGVPVPKVEKAHVHRGVGDCDLGVGLPSLASRDLRGAEGRAVGYNQACNSAVEADREVS